MRIQADFSVLRKNKWSDYLPRFLFGGLVTVAAGFVAKHFGPAVGGLFLAFPAIFPAGATLLEKREEKKKRDHGLNGSVRGRLAVALDARGAAMGCIGLACFAAIAWKLLPRFGVGLTLLMATGLWALTSVAAWREEERM
jgi:Protein of unknown function (DUF3147)